MKNNLFCLLVLLQGVLSNPLSAQNQVAGTLQDATGSPLVSANVLLLAAADSSLIRGSLTEDNGSYLFENVPEGAFLISYTMIGFERVYSKPFQLPGKNVRLQLDPIKLEESTAMLDEISVVARRPFLEQKIDRTIVNVANSITSAGGNAAQVLQRSPGVQINPLTKTISLLGKQGVVLMINGKISRLPSDAVVDMLTGMSSDNIDRIELIHTPPANFDAEGNAGIINIILKNSGEEGFNGGYSSKAGHGRGPKFGAGAYFNYRKEKLNWFGGYDYNFDLNPQVFTNYRGVLQNNDFLETETLSDRPHTPTATQNARLGADFQVSKKTVLGVLGTFFDRDWYMEAVNAVKYSRNGVVESRLRMPNSETNHSRSFTGNLNFAHQISPNQSLNVDADYIHYDMNNPSLYEIQGVDAVGNVNPQYQLRISKKTPIRVVVTKADYTINFGKNSKLEAGGKFTSMRFDNDVRVDSLPAQQNWVLLPDYTSLFHLNEFVTGGYATFSTKLNAKTDLKAGLLYEFTNSNLGSKEQPNVVDRAYGSWFPSVFLGRKLSESQTLNFSYSRRITRPKIRDLAPWLIFSDPTTQESGNPALQPSFTDAIKLDYGYKSWSVGVSYSIEKDPMRFVPIVDPVTNRQVNRGENLGNEKGWSANLYLPLHPTKWWEMGNNFYLKTTEINFELEGQKLQLSNVTYGFNTTNTFKLPRKFSLEISGNYDSPSYWGVAIWKATGSLNLGLEKNLGEKWGKLRLNASDLFLTTNWFGTTEQPEINLLVKSSYQIAERTFMLSWTNTFGNRKLKSTRERQTGATEALKRI